MAVKLRAKVLLLLMFAGCLFLLVAVPLGWLWVGSQVQGATESAGAALGVMMLGMIVSITLLVLVLGWLNRLHLEVEAARNHQIRGSALERALVASAIVAMIACAVWFVGWSGSEPLPITNPP
jgi:uncharacterized membrane protein YbhN (UPF0104 family)